MAKKTLFAKIVIRMTVPDTDLDANFERYEDAMEALKDRVEILTRSHSTEEIEFEVREDDSP